ncbi:hypothetical protein L3Q82_005569 [Scortum barcoo]|uniref:Uncharacterized protein n=1 Tax=Scortum barcoo TaxID=214431 RepID=A0ACB8V9A8_9TELE|nr:hypothetical protein L3Q82_005569 [Scortum barcoo]
MALNSSAPPSSPPKFSGRGSLGLSPGVSLAETKVRSTTVTAQEGSVVNTPQVTGVHAKGDANLNFTVHNTYVHQPNTTDETNAVPPKTKGKIERCQAALKSYLKNQTKNLSQGTKEAGSSTPLNKIYTELYITEGGSGEVNSEHEVIALERKRCSSEEKKIHLNDIFEPLPNEENPPQRVLTKGIAGIGKTVAVQKFTQDWAVGEANQTTQFIFPFTFRDLNLIHDDERLSLMTLISHYFDEVRDLETSDYDNSSLLFIFDGLDESKFPLDFKNNEICRSITETTTVDVLLTNLISGKLLHKASIWITSRPAAATKIPPEFINRVTEVRGFSDEQKEEYFQKKICDKHMAQKILDHLRSRLQRSLYIMCHIPVFCWISATALQSLLTETHKGELPKTVTEMYTHFLIMQTKMKHQKDYQEGEIDKDEIMNLGKLAFEQLQEGNIIFNEDDLKSCKIDLKQAAVYSGVCTEIIRKEYGLHKQEFYSFIHLSVQEFLAALYVLETFMDGGENLLLSQTSVKVSSEKGELPIILLHKNAVNMALVSDYGQWDLFLRFLLGLSQDKNQKLLQKAFGSKRGHLQSNEQTIKYIHEKIRKLSSTNKSINLFHCLNELGDQSLVEQVQKYQSSGDVKKISPAHWSALAFLLLVSHDELNVFDLKKYHRSDEVLERLLPVLKASKTALLSECNLTDRCCKFISSILSFRFSGLEELDLSRNQLLDSGITKLCVGLKSPNCKLQRLRLCDCGITGKSLASALSLNLSHLKNLDLSRNSLRGQAVTQLCGFLRRPDCQLERLWLSKTNLQEECAAALASSLAANPSQLRELGLEENNLGDAGVTAIACLLKNPNCKVESLRLADCQFTGSGCSALASSLKSNPAHLRVLDLARNDLQGAGVENLSEFLAEPLCQLETLNLKWCTLTVACCRLLTFALSSSSSLKELDLRHNNLMDKGVNLLSDWLRKPQCRLEILRLSDCTESSCESLALALKLNPSHLRELHLSRSFLGGSDGAKVKLH